MEEVGEVLVIDGHKLIVDELCEEDQGIARLIIEASSNRDYNANQVVIFDAAVFALSTRLKENLGL